VLREVRAAVIVPEDDHLEPALMAELSRRYDHAIE
jgi:DNA transposition AAA+ family ATPase